MWAIDGHGHWWIVRWIGESNWETVHRPNGFSQQDKEDAAEILGPWYTQVRADNMRDLKNVARHEPLAPEHRTAPAWLLYTAVAVGVVGLIVVAALLYILLTTRAL